jgi:hypothetical protein
MPRRVKLPTSEMGDVHLLLVDGWTEGWDVLKDTVFGAQVSVLSREVVDHALHRYSRPLVDALGIPPEGALRKVPRLCWHRRKRSDNQFACPLYDKHDCQTPSPKMPWCFEPDGGFDETVRKKASEAIELWREGVYVVVMEEPCLKST